METIAVLKPATVGRNFILKVTFVPDKTLGGACCVTIKSPGFAPIMVITGEPDKLRVEAPTFSMVKSFITESVFKFVLANCVLFNP